MARLRHPEPVRPRLVQHVNPRPLALRALQLLLGLFLFGLAIALMVRGGLGLGPWDAFHQGLSRLTGFSIGSVILGVGVLVVLFTTTIGVRPGPGTVANILLIGPAVDLVLPLLPAAPSRAWGLLYLLAGIGLSGVATGTYIAAGFGKGPRDGLMLGLSRYTGLPVRRVRTSIELTVLLLGWLMGGAIGVGTLVFTLAIGPAVQWGLELFGIGHA